ncbi:cyclin-T1-3-like [Lotus japonicus]|uniref:cyclin-T1-3-like n=1 Tax=Lotus japonicus TaxID=34305 RepID=UPI002582658B|nr:cyclin-T1-3-like [Lotus japonicus]
MEEGSSSRSKKRHAEDEADSSSGGKKRPAEEEAEEVPFDPRRRYVTLQEIVQHSPSKKDGIEWWKEAHCRMTSNFFIRQLGIALKRSPKIIATASYYFHKFFLLQSFAQNDPKTIGTACVFLASKIEEHRCSLRRVVVYSYWIIHQCAPAAMRLINENKEMFNLRKELIILAERVVLTTLNFNLEIQHPHDFLRDYVRNLAIESVESKKKLGQVAWDFANDGMLATLCLQFSPQQIAGGYIFLALKFLKLKLQNSSVSFWRNTFDVTTQQLEAISIQLLRIYEIFRAPIQLRGNAGDGGGARADAEAPAPNEAQAREPNTSSKGKEVVGSASGAGDGDGTSSAGDGDGASPAAETLVLLLQRTQADKPNSSSSKGKEKGEGSSTPAAGNGLDQLGVTPKHS